MKLSRYVKAVCSDAGPLPISKLSISRSSTRNLHRVFAFGSYVPVSQSQKIPVTTSGTITFFDEEAQREVRVCFENHLAWFDPDFSKDEEWIDRMLLAISNELDGRGEAAFFFLSDLEFLQ